MTQPSQIDENAVAALREHFTPEQLVEISLKVMKFNIQKVMVALGTHEWMTDESLANAGWNGDGTYFAVDQ